MMVMQMLDTIQHWQDKVTSAVTKLLVPILIIACSVGMIWAIVIGIKMMKAEDSKAREENKAKLINIAISIVAIAVLIGLFYALMKWLEADGKAEAEGGFGIFDNEKKSVVGGNLLNTFNLVKQCASMMFFGC